MIARIANAEVTLQNKVCLRLYVSARRQITITLSLVTSGRERSPISA
jgi:hypothetical protein